MQFFYENTPRVTISTFLGSRRLNKIDFKRPNFFGCLDQQTAPDRTKHTMALTPPNTHTHTTTTITITTSWIWCGFQAYTMQHIGKTKSLLEGYAWPFMDEYKRYI